ncbi:MULTISPECIES: hypothetical protein [Kitasatospora]|uniref:Halobacterial output domain-containing protein n=2 Tax=Kitasatospora TaxID=2063 RepID=A0ABT1J2J5_9ACTN|nr:hypothetical protein [Kitasatospora paracochleata]MCP2311655.1 hypothetical protein [Kitasatospora paracochleata]
MIQVSVTVITTPDDRLLIPAEQVTDLLRQLASELSQGPEADLSDLDPETARVFEHLLVDLADQVDTECIALASESEH